MRRLSLLYAKEIIRTELFQDTKICWVDMYSKKNDYKK